jgi:hypothetical protein
MANHRGSEGVVQVGTNAIAEIKGYSINETMNVIEDTALSDTAKTYQSGSTEWDGSVDCYWDETDTNGQVAMTIGSSITAKFYPEGSSTGDKYMHGTALITGISISSAVDGMIDASYTLKGTGALTLATE